VHKRRYIWIALGAGLDSLYPQVCADLGDLLALAAGAGSYPQNQRVFRLASVSLGNVDISVVAHRPMGLIEDRK